MGHRKINYTKTLEEAYNYYIRNTGKNTKTRFSRQEFVKLWHLYEEKMLENIIRKGTKWNLPRALGSIYVTKTWKPYFMDWNETKKQKKKVLAYNDDTFGYAYSLNYTGVRRYEGSKYFKSQTRRGGKSIIKRYIKEYVEKGEMMPANRVIEKQTKK